MTDGVFVCYGDQLSASATIQYLYEERAHPSANTHTIMHVPKPQSCTMKNINAVIQTTTYVAQLPLYHYRHLVLLECTVEKLNDPGLCVVPEQPIEHNSCCIKTRDVTFLANKFQHTISAMGSDLIVLNKLCKTLRLLLQTINLLSVHSNNLKVFQQLPYLLESTVGRYMYIISVQHLS